MYAYTYVTLYIQTYNLHDCILTWWWAFLPISQCMIYQDFGFFSDKFCHSWYFCPLFQDHCLPHRIQQPIPKPTCSRSFNQASSNWSNNLWKFRFVVSELVIGSGDQDNSTYVTLYAYKSELAWLHTWLWSRTTDAQLSIFSSKS